MGEVNERIENVSQTQSNRSLKSKQQHFECGWKLRYWWNANSTAIFDDLFLPSIQLNVSILDCLLVVLLEILLKWIIYYEYAGKANISIHFSCRYMRRATK